MPSPFAKGKIWMRRLALNTACALLTIAMVACKKFEEKPMLPNGFMDTPASGSVVPKITPVMGWALSEDGVDSVTIYLDRHYMMDAKTGLSRPDVKQLYPAIAGAENSGWEADLKLDGVSSGVHTITALIRSKAQSIVSVSTKVTVQ